jgi:5-methylcytosine-specific restriction endonuclease McrA
MMSGRGKRQQLYRRHWSKLNLLYGNRCHYCRQEMNQRKRHPRKMTIEHLHPKGRGGLHDIENLRLACKACNEEQNHLRQRCQRIVDAMWDPTIRIKPFKPFVPRQYEEARAA